MGWVTFAGGRGWRFCHVLPNISKADWLVFPRTLVPERHDASSRAIERQPESGICTAIAAPQVTGLPFAPLATAPRSL